MGFKKIRMGQEEIFTTIVEDINGKELERWKVMRSDYPKVVKILSSKLGLNIKVISKEKNKDRDLDWLK